jgi:hypothetical protein
MGFQERLKLATRLGLDTFFSMLIGERGCPFLDSP